MSRYVLALSGHIPLLFTWDRWNHIRCVSIAYKPVMYFDAMDQEEADIILAEYKKERKELFKNEREAPRRYCY